MRCSAFKVPSMYRGYDPMWLGRKKRSIVKHQQRMERRAKLHCLQGIGQIKRSLTAHTGQAEATYHVLGQGSGMSRLLDGVIQG